MTGFEIVREAAILAGLQYSDEDINASGLTLLNIVLTDMGLERALSLEDKPDLPTPLHTRTLIVGIARYICAGIGDAEAAAVINTEYRRELGQLKGRIALVRDTLPRGEDC